MAMKKTLKYIFSTLIVLLSLTVSAQTASRNGLSLGVDLSRIAVPFIDSTRYGWEALADIQIVPNVFVAAEVGSQTSRFSKPEYHYSSSGAYARLGVDYNFIKHLDDKSEDKIFIGARLGFSSFYHDADNLLVRDSIWGDINPQPIPVKWLTSGWTEVALGMRARLINNFYLGWSVRAKIRMWLGKDERMSPFSIPGYGKANLKNTFGVNYSLYYMIPLRKKTDVPKESGTQ